MPGYFTDYISNKFLDLMLGNAAFDPPSTLFFGLSQSAANKSGSVSEPITAGYARVAMANNLSAFPSAAGGSKTNATAINFPTPTGAWGTILSVFVADAPTSGDILAMADLTAPKSISAGSPAPTIAVGALYLSHS